MQARLLRGQRLQRVRLTGLDQRPSPRRVDDDGPAGRLADAYGREVNVVALTIPERETIIRALVDPSPGLEELRGVLLREHVGRVRYGLV